MTVSSVGLNLFSRGCSQHSLTSLIIFHSPGVCDCCDGSDEGNIVKCANTCVAAAAREKQMLEKVTAAYSAGSVVRRNDIEQIKKTKEKLLTETAPLKALVEEKRAELDSLKEMKSQAESANAELYESALSRVKLAAGNLLDLPNMPDFHIARLLSTLFSLLNLSDSEVKNSLTEAGVVLSSVDKTSSGSVHKDEDRDDDRDDKRYIDPDDNDSYDEAELVDKSDDDEEKMINSEETEERDEKVPPRENGKDVEAQAAAGESTQCTLLDHVNDSRLGYLCTHDATKQSDETATESEESIGASIALENGRTLLLHLLKTKELYTELQLLFGYHRVKGTFEGFQDFFEAHKIGDPHSCPADWAGEEFNQELCSLNEKLFEMYDSLTFIDGTDPDAHMDLAERMSVLHAQEDELAVSESSLKDFEDYSEHLEYLALRDKCFDGKDGKFTYNVCILGKLTQKDTENADSDDVLLGTYSSIEKDKNTGGVIMHFTEGTNCWAFGPRTADVHITCGPEQKMITSSEPTTCYYKFEVESPSGCTEQFAQINGIL
jgi:protein kinase C substrate 80K-H